MFVELFELACALSPGMRRFLEKSMYQFWSLVDKEALMIYMNFGYADLDPSVPKLELREEDEMNRYCIQLYQHVAGSVDLKGQDVLEVGCGRGGGASYIMRYLIPKSMTGIDVSDKAIAFCKRYHVVEGLRFLHGDAESLSFDDNSFDVVVNIESSHCYGDMERFLSEVCRVLRPKGYFLFADHHRREKIETLHQQLTNSCLEILKEERISSNVLKALECDHERKLQLIKQKVPSFLKNPFQEFAGLRGTEPYEALRTGAREYRSFTLRKATA
jgi:ubiquinone/menaquinone biosynthesis C-methylase UbiE